MPPFLTPPTPPQNIYAQIRYEVDQFLYNFISPVPGYAFNTYQTIKRIFLYLSNRYENGSYYLGREKIFFNIVTPPVEVASKMLSVDPKNIKLLPTNPESYFPTYLLEKELRQWLKKSEMGKILNQIADEAPRYGSVFLEKTKDGAKVCDIRRTMYDPSVERILDSRFITTITYMADYELRKAGKENGWDMEAVELAIERFGNTQAAQAMEDFSGNLNVMRSSPQVKVYKRYGEVPDYWLDEKAPIPKDGVVKMVRSLFICAGPDVLQRNTSGQIVGELGVTLWKGQWRGAYPFKDFHYTKIKGRLLGMGVVEMLFDVQTRFNEIKNQKRLAGEISALHLFTTKDKSLVRNVLTDLENGDILFSPNGIDPIVNEERNLEYFDQEETSYGTQVDKLTFAYEAIRGENQPGDQTLGEVQIQVASATGVYGFKKKNLRYFLKDFFNDLVMPQLIKDLTPEHIMRFVGSSQEIDKLDQAAAELYANEVIIKTAMAGGKVDSALQDTARKKAIGEYRKQGTNRFLKIKEQFYKDAEFEFDFDIENQDTDPNTMIQGIQALFGFLQNPATLQDPRMKMLFYQAAEQFGIPPAEMEFAEDQATQMQQDGRLPTLQGAPNQQQPQGQGQQQQVQPQPQARKVRSPQLTQ